MSRPNLFYAYYPLILYSGLGILSLLVLARRRRLVETHIPILYFLAFLFPYALHAILASRRQLGYAALYALDSDSYLRTVTIFFGAAFATVLVYAAAFRMIPRPGRHRQKRWILFTERWWGAIRWPALLDPRPTTCGPVTGLR